MISSLYRYKYVWRPSDAYRESHLNAYNDYVLYG